MKGNNKMIDRRTKNAEIFRDTEHKYKSDFELIAVIQESTKNQTFISEKATVNISVKPKAQKARIVVSSKRKRSFDSRCFWLRRI